MKIILTLAVLGLTALNAWARPNIVLIMADDVGCEPIGAYGGERWKTPHIDALAKSGMRFDYCFAMPVCHPTRTTLIVSQERGETHAGAGAQARGLCYGRGRQVAVVPNEKRSATTDPNGVRSMERVRLA